MAAAHYPGGLRPHPPGLRPGPRPSSKMARQVRTGAAAGGHLLAGFGTGATEPPSRSRAPPASQAMTLRVTLAQPGNPRRKAGSPDEEMPKPPAGGLAGGARHLAGQLDSEAGQVFDKQKRKMIRPWFRPAAVPWKITATQTRASGENRVSTKSGVLQDLPRAIEQVTNHLQILSGAGGEPGLADEQGTGSSEGRRSAARRNGGGGPPGVRGLTAVKAVSCPGVVGGGRGSSRGVARAG